MDKSRRKFFKLAVAAGATTAIGKTAHAASANKHFEGHEDAYGILHDITKCVGCRSCEEACNEVNDLPKPEKPFDNKEVLTKDRMPKSGEFTVINKFDGVGPGGSPLFRKFQCHHCLEPACAAACFVGAFTKTPEGAVVYDPSICVGCRYCMVACPWNLPGYEYNNPRDPKIVRSTMCYPRIKEGKVPGCVEACPMEALTFGKRDDILKIARERIRKHPDRYVNHIYGEHESGGTSWLFLSGTDFNKVGLPTNIGNAPPQKLTGGALGAVPMVVGLWPVLLSGIYAMTKRKEKIAKHEKNSAVQAMHDKCKKEEADALAAATKKAKTAQKKAIDRAVKKALADAKKKAQAEEKA